MTNGLLDRVARIEQKFEDLVALVQAVTRTVGPQEVQEEVWNGIRQTQATTVAEFVRAGKIRLAADGTVRGDSFVVAFERNKDGATLPPGRFQVSVRDLDVPSRAVVLGLQVGDAKEMPNGNTVVIGEVYEPVPVEKEAAPKARRRKRPAKAAAPALKANTTTSPKTLN